MTPRDAAPLLLLAAIAWTSAAQGGTRAVDLVVVVVLLAVAAPTARPVLPRTAAALAAVVSSEIWLLVDGPRGTTVDLATLRVPALVLVVVLSVRVAVRLDDRGRSVVRDGLLVIGTVQACVAIGQAALSAGAGNLVRAGGLLGNPNALGVLIVATGAATLWATGVFPTVVSRWALGAQGLALILTGSRLALLVAVVVLAWFVLGTATRRARIVAVAWSAGAVAVIAGRIVSGEEDRLALWTTAFHEIALHPLAGRGAEPVVYDVPGLAIRPTTHAHNELLQLAVEYGLVGVVLLAGATVLALRATGRPGSGRAWAAVGAVALVSSGLTDFGLRITAITTTAAVLAAVALAPRRA